jgi:DNA polymerase-3 subunit gamma/tau
LSRCQIFDFKRINVTDAKNYLKVIAEEQGITADDDALHIIAQKADGAMRDALSIFDRVVSFSGKNLTRQAVTENLNVLDYDTFFGATDLILANKIPDLLLHFNLIISKGFDGHHFITGLASHFRDLLVSKTPQTIELIEVGDDTKAMYKAQSESTSQAFLIQAIELANDCDLKYKTSKNQRLLVELCLMQLASINFDVEKKKPSGFIIPASYFRSKSIPEVKITQPESTSKTTTQEQKKELTAVFQKIEEPQTPYPKKELPTPVIKSTQRPTSGLSLSSIRKKKEHQIKLMEVTVDEEDLPNDPFTLETIIKFWNIFVTKLEADGKYNLAAILQIDTPKLINENTIRLEFPNTTNKIEVERQQFELLQYLRKAVNNFSISLDIIVNETLEKQYAYTPEDKYQKLVEKNIHVELLRKTFDLDL